MGLPRAHHPCSFHITQKASTSTRPRGWVDLELYRPMAHKGTIGSPPRGPGGPPGFSGLGTILVKPFPGRVWGEIGTPKGSWVPCKHMQTIPLAKNPGKPRGVPIPPQSYVFRAPFLAPKGPPGLRGPRPSPWAPKMGSGVKNIKVAY